MTRKLLLILLAVGVLAVPASATEMFEKVGTVGFQFLEIGAGARGTAMGEAMVGASEGIESLYWNPAGLRYVTEPTVLFAQTWWPADIAHQYFGFALRPGIIPGIVGFSVTSLSMDSMPVRTADVPEGVGVDFQCSDLAIGVTYAMVFTDKFSAGGTLKRVSSGLGDLSVLGVEGLGDYHITGYLMDFGTLYDTGFRSLKIGLAIQNMGPGATYIEDDVPVPATFKFGISMEVIDTPGQRVTVAAEFRHPSDTSEKINVGAEYALSERYFARVGYKMNYDEETFSAGGGTKMFVESLGYWISIDYSYADFGYLGAVHRIGMAFAF